jgi:hypothetical protein
MIVKVRFSLQHTLQIAIYSPSKGQVSYDGSLIVQAIVIVLVNYDRKTFIVQTIDVSHFQHYLVIVDAFTLV